MPDFTAPVDFCDSGSLRALKEASLTERKRLQNWLTHSFKGTKHEDSYTIRISALNSIAEQLELMATTYDAQQVPPIKRSICSYCNEVIMPDHASVADPCGEPGERMHLGCSVADAEGSDVDRDMGDS